MLTLPTPDRPEVIAHWHLIVDDRGQAPGYGSNRPMLSRSACDRDRDLSDRMVQRGR